MDVFVGLDLGALVDYTAAAVIERTISIGSKGWPERNSFGIVRSVFTCTAIRRYELGTPYSRIVDHIATQLKRSELQPRPRLVLDSSGVGAGVLEMFESALSASEVEVHAITITAGRGSSVTGRRRYHVSKLELVGAIRESLEAGRLRVPRDLEHANTLARELQEFRVKVTAAATETFSAREGQHDDLVLALSLPVWLASQRIMELYVDPDGPRPDQLPADASHRFKIEARERYAYWLESMGVSQAEWETSRNPNAREAPVDIDDVTLWE
jgi:hypothetical protein